MWMNEYDRLKLVRIVQENGNVFTIDGTPLFENGVSVKQVVNLIVDSIVIADASELIKKDN